MAVSLRHRDRTVSSDPHHHERVLASRGNPGQCCVPQHIGYERLDARRFQSKCVVIFRCIPVRVTLNGSCREDPSAFGETGCAVMFPEESVNPRSQWQGAGRGFRFSRYDGKEPFRGVEQDVGPLEREHLRRP
jgi:hypothetical protein